MVSCKTWAWKFDWSVQRLKKGQTHAQTPWGPVGHAHTDGVCHLLYSSPEPQRVYYVPYKEELTSLCR